MLLTRQRAKVLHQCLRLNGVCVDDHALDVAQVGVCARKGEAGCRKVDNKGSKQGEGTAAGWAVVACSGGTVAKPAICYASRPKPVLLTVLQRPHVEASLLAQLRHARPVVVRQRAVGQDGVRHLRHSGCTVEIARSEKIRRHCVNRLSLLS